MIKIEEMKFYIDECKEALREATYAEDCDEMYYWHNTIVISELNLEALQKTERQ